jgi:Cysteine rich repeat
MLGESIWPSATYASFGPCPRPHAPATRTLGFFAVGFAVGSTSGRRLGSWDVAWFQLHGKWQFWWMVTFVCLSVGMRAPRHAVRGSGRFCHAGLFVGCVIPKAWEPQALDEGACATALHVTGQSRVKTCLEEHRADDGFSADCRAELEAMMERRMVDFRLDTNLKEKCLEDIEDLCDFEDVRPLSQDWGVRV